MICFASTASIRSCTSRPRRTWIAPSSAPNPSSRPMWSAHSHLLEAARRFWLGDGSSDAGSASLPSRLHRRGLRIPRSRRPRLLRDHTLRAQLAVRSLQGRQRSPRPRLRPHLWPARHHLQLLQQLRPLPVPREAHSLDDPECPGRQAAAGLRRWSADSRLALRGGSLRGHPGHTWSAACPARRTTSVAAISRPISPSSRPSATCWTSSARPPATHRRLIQYVTDRPGHDRRYAMDITKIRRELGLAAAPYHRRRAPPHRRVVPRAPRLDRRHP